MAAGSTPIVKTIATFLPQEHVDKLHEIGYTFQELLGEGAFGAAFRCQFTNIDPQTHENVVETYAAKVVMIPYIPSLRFRTPREVKQLEEYQEITISYRMKGQLVNENVLWRRTGSQVPPDAFENPMLKEQESLIRLKVDYIETELQAMDRAEHENVIKLKNIIRFYDNYPENPFMTSAVIFMELADGGDLNTFLRNKQCSEDECKRIMAQISCGVEHLHSRGIAHLDLKPDNILIFNPNQNTIYKITDFGLSMVFDPGVTPVLTVNRGTALFRCPAIIKQLFEIRSGVRTEMRYDPSKADVFSLGVIILVIMYGRRNIALTYNQVKPPQQSYSNAFLRFLSTQQHSQLLDHLMQQVLVDEQNNRININQFCEHKWIHDAIVAYKTGDHCVIM